MDNKNNLQWDDQKKVWVGERAIQSASSEILPKPLWIFGYGSLCFKFEEIPYTEMIDCSLQGFTRRFWQYSCDHRGTPENPGLVSTLISDQEMEILKSRNLINDCEEFKDSIGIVHGKAFKIPDDKINQVIDKLDFREKGGYQRNIVEISYKGQTIKALVYTATIDNPNCACKDVGKSLQSSAQIIAKSQGPSGKNSEYFFKFIDYLRSINKLSSYEIKLEQLVKEQLSKSN